VENNVGNQRLVMTIEASWMKVQVSCTCYQLTTKKGVNKMLWLISPQHDIGVESEGARGASGPSNNSEGGPGPPLLAVKMKSDARIDIEKS